MAAKQPPVQTCSLEKYDRKTFQSTPRAPRAAQASQSPLLPTCHFSEQQRVQMAGDVSTGIFLQVSKRNSAVQRGRCTALGLAATCCQWRCQNLNKLPRETRAGCPWPGHSQGFQQSPPLALILLPLRAALQSCQRAEVNSSHSAQLTLAPEAQGRSTRLVLHQRCQKSPNETRRGPVATG